MVVGYGPLIDTSEKDEPELIDGTESSFHHLSNLKSLDIELNFLSAISSADGFGFQTSVEFDVTEDGEVHFIDHYRRCF